MKDVYTLADLEDWPRLMRSDEPPIRLGVIGHPVAHSRSPQMQNAALLACDFPMRYARFHISAAELPSTFLLLTKLNFVGVNLTIPHKRKGAALVDRLDDLAVAAGGVNTIRIEGEKLVGFNTDGGGFAAAIRGDFGLELRGLRVLVLGAGGGAGRAIALQCAREGCGQLTLVNRTEAKAQQLAAELSAVAIPWEEHALRHAIAGTDLLINATSIGMARAAASVIPAAWLHRELIVYDTIYDPNPTALLMAAQKVGARNANGLSMLLHQGALAFELWFGRAAPVAEMRAALLGG